MGCEGKTCGIERKVLVLLIRQSARKGKLGKSDAFLFVFGNLIHNRVSASSTAQSFCNIASICSIVLGCNFSRNIVAVNNVFQLTRNSISASAALIINASDGFSDVTSVGNTFCFRVCCLKLLKNSHKYNLLWLYY